MCNVKSNEMGRDRSLASIINPYCTLHKAIPKFPAMANFQLVP